MAKTLTLTPVLYMTLGALGSYYGLGLLEDRGPGVLLLGFMLITAISLMRVLIHAPVQTEVHHGFRRAYRYLIALSLGFILGLGDVSPSVWLGIPGTKIIGIYGTLQEDPRSLSNGRGMGSLVLQRVSGTGGIRASARGKIPVFFPGEAIPRLKEFGRGSEVYIEGLLLPSKVSAGNPEGKNLLFQAQSVHIVVPASALEQFRTGLRLKLVKRFAGSDWGGLALALLLGVRDNLDTEFSKSYQYAGCTYMLALSGMHLSIIVGMIAFLLKKPLGLKPAGIISMGCILIYVYLVGDLPSLNRAAIMYILGTLAVLGTLPRQPASLLGMAFLIQISLQPESGHSISFILSYLSLGGIIFIGEAIHALIQGIAPEIATQPLAASLGAFIATAAVVVLFFGVLRPIGILAGLVIVPLTTFFMIGSIIALVLDIPFLAKPLGMILSLWYDILEGLASLAGRVPGIAVSNPVPVAVASLGLGVLCILLRNRQNAGRKNLAPFD